MWHVPLCVTDGVGLERRLRNSETRTEWLDPKKAPSVGNPVSFRIFRVPFRRSENAPGYPREGAFFGSSHSVLGPRLRISKSPFQTDAVGLTARHMPTREQVLPIRVLLSSGFAFTDPRFSVGASCCVTSAETLVAHQQHHAQLVGAPGTNALAVW